MAADLLRELERLPSDWNYAVTRDGRLFFINDRTQSTTWVHPVTGVPIQSGHQPSPGLPAGWEKAVTPDGILYYIDHNCRATTCEHPATNRPLDQSHRTSRSPVGSPRSPTSSQALTHKQNNKSQPKQRNLKAPTAHRDENSRITMRGWLHRQEGASMKTWKRRWCVLADYALFFYKDDTENLCMESILLPSFRISECTQSDNANRRYAFKAKHGNLKTNYFAADRHEDMNRWIEHLQSAASLKAGLGPTTEKNNTVKFVPKSPIMTWDDDNSSPLSPTSLSSSQFGPGYWSTSNSQQQFQGPERKHSVHNGGPGYHSSREQLARRQQHSPHDGSQDTSPNYPHQKETFPTSDVDRTGGRDSYPWHSDKYHVPPESTVMSSVRYGPTVRSGNENPNYQQKRLYSKHLQQPENRYNDQHHPEQSYRFDPERGSYSRMPGGQDLQRLSYSKQLVDENDPHRQRNSEHTRQFPPSGADTQHLGYPKSKTNRRDPQRSRSEERDLQNRSRRRDEKSLYPVQTGQIGSADQRQSHSRFPDYPSDRNLQGNHQPDSQNSAHAHGFTHSPHLKPHGQNHSPQERQYQRSRSADRLEKPVLQDSRFPSHYAPAVQDRLGQTSFDSPDRRHRSQSEDKSLDNRPAHPPLSGSADNRKTSQNRQDSHYRSRYPEDQYVSSRERRQEPLLSSQHDHKQENSAGFCRQPGSRVLVSSNPSMKDPNSRYIDNRPIDPHYDKYADQQQKPRERTFPHKEEKDRNRYGDAIQRDSESRDVPPTGHHDPHSILDSRRSRGVDSMQNSQEFHSRQHMRSSYSPQQRDSQSNFPDDRNGHQRYSQSGISEDRVSYARLKKPDDPLRHNKDLPDKRDNRGGGSLPHDRNFPVHEKVQYAELIHKQPKPVNIDEESPYAVVRKPWLTQKPEPAVNAQQKSARQREDIEYSDRLSDDKWKERADPLLGAVYDGSDRPESLSTSTEGPVRPPLPAEVHHQIVEDIAHNRSPKTSDDYLQAEDNLEQRMKKPSYFEYPSLSSFDAKIGYQEIKVVPAQSQFSDSLRQGRYPGDQQQMDPERRLVTGPIHTVKEEPDMPDTDVIETELRKLSKDPLTTRGLRMSINAGDLIGKTHDELVLLLIQLRRNQSAVEKARDYYRSRLEIKRPAEHQYRRQVIENIGPIDSYLESEHAQYSETRKYCEEVENKLEVYRPLVNLVSNMVTMGSLYGGDNQMMATQYRKHLLSPDQYVPPKKMLEFSRKQQEDKIVKEMEDEVQQLSMEEVDLEDKVDRLCQLDRLIQEYSFKVVTFREDKELLEKALQRILKQQDLSRDNPRDLEHLTHQQRTIEKELTLVMYQLAEASKELEEITAENNKVEHEVTLLRSKVHSDLTRSRSAPSLSNDNLKVKMKMEKDLAKVHNMMEGLSKEGARLSEAMNTLRRSSSSTALNKDQFESVPPKKVQASSYMETDLDTLEAKDLGDVSDLSSPPFRSAPGNDDHVPPVYQPRSSSVPATSDHKQLELLSMDHQLPTYDISGYGDLGMAMDAERDGESPWDISEADENTKRFYGLLPKDKPKVLTVRDVKRQAGQRKERDKQRKGPDDPNMDSTLPEYNWKQPSGQVQSTEPDEVKPMTRHWSSFLSQPAASSGTASVGQPIPKLSLRLMTPRPFVKFQDPSARNTKVTSNIPVSSSLLITSTSTSTSHSAPLYSATTHNTRPSSMSHSQQTLDKDTSPTFSDLYNVKKSTRGRYLTISSSQPIKLETIVPQPYSRNSSAGDLMSNLPVMPDIVKSSTAKADQIDENLIEREILYAPQKVEIPERYNPESDEEVTAEEKLIRQEKAEKIKQLLAQQSIHSMSQPDISKVGGQLHERVEHEKEKRAELLKVGQQLAKQVTLKSRKAAAERRKTWSGSASSRKYNSIPAFDEDHGAGDQMVYNSHEHQVRDY